MRRLSRQQTGVQDRSTTIAARILFSPPSRSSGLTVAFEQRSFSRHHRSSRASHPVSKVVFSQHRSMWHRLVMGNSTGWRRARVLRRSEEYRRQPPALIAHGVVGRSCESAHIFLRLAWRHAAGYGSLPSLLWNKT